MVQVLFYSMHNSPLFPFVAVGQSEVTVMAMAFTPGNVDVSHCSWVSCKRVLMNGSPNAYGSPLRVFALNRKWRKWAMYLYYPYLISEVTRS